MPISDYMYHVLCSLFISCVDWSPGGSDIDKVQTRWVYKLCFSGPEINHHNLASTHWCFAACLALTKCFLEGLESIANYLLFNYPLVNSGHCEHVIPCTLYIYVWLVFESCNCFGNSFTSLLTCISKEIHPDFECCHPQTFEKGISESNLRGNSISLFHLFIMLCILFCQNASL